MKDLAEIAKEEIYKMNLNLLIKFKEELKIDTLIIPKKENNFVATIRGLNVWKNIVINKSKFKYLQIDEYNNLYVQFSYKPSLECLYALHRICNEYLEFPNSYHHRSGRGLLIDYCRTFGKSLSKSNFLKMLSWDNSENNSLIEHFNDKMNPDFFDKEKIVWDLQYKFKFEPFNIEGK